MTGNNSETTGNDGPWEVTVDRTLCIGSGICAGTAPERFTLSNGKSQPISATSGPDEALLDAADSCPVEAIAVHERRTGRLVAPQE